MAFNTQLPQQNMGNLTGLIQQADPFSALGKTMTELDGLMNQRMAKDYISGLDQNQLNNYDYMTKAFMNAPEEAKKELGANLQALGQLQSYKQKEQELQQQQQLFPTQLKTLEEDLLGKKLSNTKTEETMPYLIDKAKYETNIAKSNSMSIDELNQAKIKEADLKYKKFEADIQKTLWELKNKGALTGKDKFDTESKIRNEYQKVMGDAIKTKEAYEKIKTTNPKTAAGQMSLIFQYMKILDPGSTVREGEFANASNTTGIAGRIMNMYNDAAGGKFLTEDQINSFKEEARSLAASFNQKNTDVKNTLRKSIKEYGLSEDNIFGKETVNVPTENNNSLNTNDLFR